MGDYIREQQDIISERREIRYDGEITSERWEITLVGERLGQRGRSPSEVERATVPAIAQGEVALSLSALYLYTAEEK